MILADVPMALMSRCLSQGTMMQQHGPHGPMAPWRQRPKTSRPIWARRPVRGKEAFETHSRKEQSADRPCSVLPAPFRSFCFLLALRDDVTHEYR